MTTTGEPLTDPPHPQAADVVAEEVARQMAFLTPRLPAPPATVLDAGCGTGDLAAALGERGYDVTAVDIDPAAVAAARSAGVSAVRADIAEFDTGPFDVVVFSLSLHHVDRLDAAVKRVRRLLKPTGLLVVDEFAWDAADRRTAAWFYDAAALLDSAGLWRGPDHHRPAAGPLDRWVRHHRDDHRMHSGDAMLHAIAAAFDIREEARVPYLHRYLGGRLAADASARAAFTRLREQETVHVNRDRLRPVGLRVIAHPHPDHT
jgi:SAM-dependent methyltransferase